MAIAQIDIAHSLVLRNFLRRSGGQRASLVQYRYPVTQLEDDVHVVLDHQQADAGRQLADIGSKQPTLGRGKPRCRLVQKQKPRLAMEYHGQFELPLRAMGELSYWFIQIV